MKTRRKSALGLVISVAMTLGGSSIAYAEKLNQSSNPSLLHEIFVGSHLHTMTVMGDKLFVTGHDGAGMSSDGGRTWNSLSALNAADIMSWTSTPTSILAGGHVGLFKSTDKGLTFKKVKFFGSVTDVHAIGSSGRVVYIGSPQIGFLISDNGGSTWKLRNAKIGQGFMGSMLIDPKNPKRIVAPDMSQGLVTSADGGLTWTSFGGPPGPMALAWNPKNRKVIAAIGMMTSGITSNGGKTWTEISVPTGAAAIDFSADGKNLIVASLVGTKAEIFSSANQGKSWQQSSSPPAAKKQLAMDPNMPGMDHLNSTETSRPVALALGTFGVGTSAVFVTAIFLRKKDQATLAAKRTSLTSRGSSQ